MSLNKRHNLSELFFCLKLLQNRCIAVATELFLSRFKREKNRSKVSIIWTPLLTKCFNPFYLSADRHSLNPSILIILEISLSSVWQDLLAFVKNPRLDPLPTPFLEQPQKIFPYLIALDFLLMIPIMGIIGATGIEDTDHELTKMLDNPILLVLFAVVLAPILEELMFRFPIGNWWKVPVRLWGAEVTEWSIVKWCQANFKTLFWVFTIVFAAVHFTNFAATVPFYFAPILVLPQLVLGVMLGYIRVGWGTRYSMLFHAIHNGIPVSFLLLGGAFVSTQ